MKKKTRQNALLLYPFFIVPETFKRRRRECYYFNNSSNDQTANVELKCQTGLKKIKSDTEQRYILSEKKTDKVIKCQNGVRQKISRQD